MSLLDDFDLKSHTEKLKKAVQKSYEANLDVLFSPSALKSLRFLLEKYERRQKKSTKIKDSRWFFSISICVDRKGYFRSIMPTAT